MHESGSGSARGDWETSTKPQWFLQGHALIRGASTMIVPNSVRTLRVDHPAGVGASSSPCRRERSWRIPPSGSGGPDPRVRRADPALHRHQASSLCHEPDNLSLEPTNLDCLYNTRGAMTPADPCTGARRRDFLLGIRRGQLVGAHVPSQCSMHEVEAWLLPAGEPAWIAYSFWLPDATMVRRTPPDGIYVPKWRCRPHQGRPRPIRTGLLMGRRR